MPVVERVADVDGAPERPSQGDKERQPERGRDHKRIRQPEMADGKTRQTNRQPRHADNVDEREQEKGAIAPGDDEIFHHRSAQDEFHQCGNAERKPQPVAFRAVGPHEVVPAEPVKIGGYAPIRSESIDRPACHRVTVRQLRGRNLALHAPGFVESRHFANEAAMLVFRADRLIARHLHETTLAHLRRRHCKLLASLLRGFLRCYGEADQARPYISSSGALRVSCWRQGQIRSSCYGKNAIFSVAAAVELDPILRYTRRSH